MVSAERISIAFLGSCVPRRCGIATFGHDLAGALVEHIDSQPLGVSERVRYVAVNDRDGAYSYGPEVIAQIGQHRKEDYRNAAELLNTSKIDVLSLQHEYGLFGGDCGEYLFDLFGRLTKPVVSTLHTVLTDPSERQREVLRHVCDRSSAVIVMAERARTLLREVYDAPCERVHVIHHGVPDVPLGDTEPFKERFHVSGRPTILTFGLLSSNKGIELMLDTLAEVVPDFPEVVYIVLGVTHPGVVRESGESYRMSLESRAVKLGIHKNVRFHNHYVSLADLCEYLQAADIYVTPYRDKEQITSGTLAYALASGKAIISTPYWYAQELLADGRGRLVEFDDVKGLADNLRELLRDRDTREAIRHAAYEYGRQMTWSRVGKQYCGVFEQAHAEAAERRRQVAAVPAIPMRLSLPEVRLDHLFAMTDDTGILQHAVYATPDRRHGYSTDDVARALIVTVMMNSLFQDEKVMPILQRYLSYLHYAQPGAGERFRNFMSYDRRWLEPAGSEDCQGRVMWALGHLVSHAPNRLTQQLARDQFRSGLPVIEMLTFPRSWALSVLGLHYYLRVFREDVPAREMMETLGGRLDKVFSEHESDDWPWFEDEVTYDNGRLPQALIIAGFDLGRRDMVERGLRSLRWLLDVQTAEEGHLSVIGNKGWYRRGDGRARYDQQCLESAALIGACKAAHRVSGDVKWLGEMRRCFDWYLGRNDAGVAMVDFKTGGCYDGLMPSGFNPNQGAESVLSWLLSLLIMHEMQTGDPPDVG